MYYSDIACLKSTLYSSSETEYHHLPSVFQNLSRTKSDAQFGRCNCTSIVDRGGDGGVDFVAHVRLHEQLRRVGQFVVRLQRRRRTEDVPAAAL